MKPTLWSQKHNDQSIYFYCGDGICTQCQSRVDAEGIFVSSWGRRTKHELFCFGCMRTLKERVYVSQERRVVRICNIPPRGALPVMLDFHGFQESKIGLFEAAMPGATKQMHCDAAGATVIDRTKYAGRPGYTLDPAAQIGLSVHEVDMLESWKKDDTKLLDFHREASPVVPDTKRLTQQ